MSDHKSRLLPEGLPTTNLVDDIEFTEVTDNGEVYTLYRIVRFTEELIGHPEGWTHVANVVRVREPAIGVAYLQVHGRVILEARVNIITG